MESALNRSVDLPAWAAEPAKEGLLALAVGVGLQVLQTMMEESVTTLAADPRRRSPDTTPVRHPRAPSSRPRRSEAAVSHAQLDRSQPGTTLVVPLFARRLTVAGHRTSQAPVAVGDGAGRDLKCVRVHKAPIARNAIALCLPHVGRLGVELRQFRGEGRGSGGARSRRMTAR